MGHSYVCQNSTPQIPIKSDISNLYTVQEPNYNRYYPNNSIYKESIRAPTLSDKLQIVHVFESFLNYPVDINKHNLRCSTDIFTLVDNKGCIALQPPSEINTHGITGVVAVYDSGYVTITESSLLRDKSKESESTELENSMAKLFYWLEPKLSNETSNGDIPEIRLINVIGKIIVLPGHIFYLEELYDYITKDFSHWNVIYDPEISPFLLIQRFRQETGCRINFIPSRNSNELAHSTDYKDVLTMDVSNGFKNELNVGFGDLSKLTCDLHSKANSIIQTTNNHHTPLFHRWPDDKLRAKWLLQDLNDQEKVRFLKSNDDFGNYSYLKCVIIVTNNNAVIHSALDAECIQESYKNIREILEFFSGTPNDRFAY